MRIALVGPVFPLRGGIAHCTALLYRKLRERGNTTSVVSFKRMYPDFLFPGKTQYETGDPLISVDSAELLDSINPFTWIKTAHYLKKLQPDVIVFQYWMPFFAPCYATVAFMAKRFLKVRIVYICHNIIPHEHNILNRILSRIGLKRVDDFIVHSQSVGEDLLKLLPKAKIQHAPHPVHEIFPPAVDKATAKEELMLTDNRVLLYFGYIRPYKGIKTLIKAMPHALTKVDVRLIIAGEFYEEKEETLQLIKELDIEKNVWVTDTYIPGEEVAHYFCAADLVVLPYITATQSGIVQVAYHYNKPVVVTDVGGLPEVVLDEKTGFVVPPKDPVALGEAIIRFYSDERESDFIENIRTEKQKYAWDRVAEAVESTTADI